MGYYYAGRVRRVRSTATCQCHSPEVWTGPLMMGATRQLSYNKFAESTPTESLGGTRPAGGVSDDSSHAPMGVPAGYPDARWLPVRAAWANCRPASSFVFSLTGQLPRSSRERCLVLYTPTLPTYTYSTVTYVNVLSGPKGPGPALGRSAGELPRLRSR